MVTACCACAITLRSLLHTLRANSWHVHHSYRIKERDAVIENNFSLRFSLHCILAGKYVCVHRQGEHMKTHSHTKEKDKHCYYKKNSRRVRNVLASGRIVFIQGNKKIQLRGKTFSETLRSRSLIYFSRPRKQKQGF
jgi:hypothetical protein